MAQRKADGGLRATFHQNIKDAQWTAIETGVVSLGVPDSEYCFAGGIQGWIEFKRCKGNVVTIRPQQVSWIERRARLGGRVFVIVMRGEELFVYQGRDVRLLKTDGLKGATPLMTGWDWDQIRQILRS